MHAFQWMRTFAMAERCIVGDVFSGDGVKWMAVGIKVAEPPPDLTDALLKAVADALKGLPLRPLVDGCDEFRPRVCALFLSASSANPLTRNMLEATAFAIVREAAAQGVAPCVLLEQKTPYAMDISMCANMDTPWVVCGCNACTEPDGVTTAYMGVALLPSAIEEAVDAALSTAEMALSAADKALATEAPPLLPAAAAALLGE